MAQGNLPLNESLPLITVKQKLVMMARSKVTHCPGKDHLVQKQVNQQLLNKNREKIARLLNGLVAQRSATH